jgi:hypothetical protein
MEEAAKANTISLEEFLEVEVCTAVFPFQAPHSDAPYLP